MPTPNPIAFTLFGLDIRWYGIIIAAAILIAGTWACRRAPKHNLTGDSLVDILLFSVPAGLLGARMYYVAFRWSYYSQHIGQILNYRAGGLAIHGGLLGACLAAYLVCRYKKVDFLDALDLCVPAIALAQAIGRWGNYFNSEAHGGPTNLPWAITVDGVSVHPTFLYESLWCLFLFFFLQYMDEGRTFVGKTTSLYLILYSLERFCVEALRTDSLMIGPFKQAQVLSLCLILGGLVLFTLCKKKRVLNYETYMAAGDPSCQKDKKGNFIKKAVKTPGER